MYVWYMVVRKSYMKYIYIYIYICKTRHKLHDFTYIYNIDDQNDTNDNCDIDPI